ncbi:VAO-type flavoprotein oxidase VAO615 [Aplysia californica]|uniref:VAO-type flavoprotein oxidase VAO615 n=1 Tax=Aplysia californica TaxID=6500 RepID=A0ABM0ZW98_APLCA|nr:VAO-type flavoprotein oxidase VAO615 [Aplysia californica]
MRPCALVLTLVLTWSTRTMSDPASPKVSHEDGSKKSNRQRKFTPARNFPGMPGFPPQTVFKQLALELKDKVVFPVDESFHVAILRHNLRTIRFPYVVVYVDDAQDIKRVLKLGTDHNLMVTIQSSGHSYIGRSTYDGCIQINLGKMKKRTVNLNSERNEAGEITVESGNSWLEVYTEVDKIQRVVVGGSAHTVAMGGYTQGGGHSPIGRALGLAVDNLLEATLVLVDGRVVTVSEKGQVVQVGWLLAWCECTS